MEQFRELEKASETTTARADTLALQAELSLTQSALRASRDEAREHLDGLAEMQQIAMRVREQYHALLERSGVAFVVSDPEGRIREANGACAALLRSRPDGLRGRRLGDFISPSRLAVYRQQLRRLVQDGAPDAILLKLVSRDGDQRTVTATVLPILDREGEAIELRWLLIPKTDYSLDQIQKLWSRVADAEQSRDASDRRARSMAQLLAWVSHELRTPVSSIAGFADILMLGARGDLTPEQRALVDRIQHAQTHLISLLDDLATYATVGWDRLQLHIAGVALAPLVQRLVALVEPLAAAREVRITSANGETLAVRADEERVLQILLNLVTNALKHSPPSGRVEIQSDGEGDMVVVQVRDSGKGVPPDARERIFEPYVQLDSGSASPSGSVGLGLAIARGLARAMGGDLTCTDGVGGGSAFVLRLPRFVDPALSP
jgi:PAS domain S-box-containing protein